jgi:CYTH domain-containing protein
MGKEIERKFLVKGNDWRKLAKGTHYRQGYLSTVKERTVRVRTINDKGFLTVKGITVDASRVEFEYNIPVNEANEMLKICEHPIIEKLRYKIEYCGFIWDVDEFHGVNKSLITAEIELQSADQKFDKPDWIGEEVTGDTKYFNSNLIKNPFTKW